jgi:AraC-like DNA-binding protein
LQINLSEKLSRVIGALATTEGYSDSYLEEVSLFRAEKKYERVPLVYDQSICISIQGKKMARMSDKTLVYDPEHFLVVPVMVPFDCETESSLKAPFLGINISIDFFVVQEIMNELGDRFLNALETIRPQPGIYVESADMIEDPVLRLLECLKTKEDSAILGKQILREIYYRTLLGKNGHILAAAAYADGVNYKVSKTLQIIHDEFAKPLDIPTLAKEAGMSLRSFYGHFKTITSCTPLQYIKKIRLDKARQLLVNQKLQANVVAYMVGYESTSQFSREYKRHFGYPPSETQFFFSPNLVNAQN